MSQQDARSALAKALVDANLGVALVSQNAKTTPANKEPWAMVTFSPDPEPQPITMGTQGDIQARGEFGIQLNFPNADGVAPAQSMAERIVSIYQDAGSLLYKSQWVRIENAGYSVAGNAGPYFRINIRISWRARFPRISA